MKYIFFTLFLLVSWQSVYCDDLQNFKNEFDELLKSNPDTLYVKATQLRNSSLQNNKKTSEAFALMYIGLYFSKTGWNDKSVEAYLEAEKLMLKYKMNEYLGVLYSSMGAIYRHLKDFKKADQYFKNAMNPQNNIDQSLKAKVLNRIGDMQRDMGNIDSAYYYYYLSIEFSKKDNLNILANNYNNLGDLFHEKKMYDSAAFYFNKSNQILIPLKVFPEICENYYSLALLELELGNKNNSIQMMNKAIETIENDSSSYELYNAYQVATEIYTKLKLDDSLAKYLQKLLWLEKKGADTKLSKNIMALELEQKVYKQGIENDLLKRESKLKDLVNYLLFVVVILVIIAGFLLWRQIKLKKKENELLFEQNEQIRQAKEELQAAYDNINELNATKDKFFSIIAHDLKSPLGSFRELTKLLYDAHLDFTEEEKLEFIELMKDSAKNIYSLLENLLEWSRSQRGTIQFEPSTNNLNNIIDENINLAKPTADNKKIKILNQIDSTIFLNIDKNMITTVIRNLLSNAIKFTPENGIIKINAKKYEDKIEVSVIDNGIGMCQDTISKLFRIDVNVTTLGTLKEKGTGLGLILCKEFVELHKGKIWVESEVNVGSTFKFTLPI